MSVFCPLLLYSVTLEFFIKIRISLEEILHIFYCLHFIGKPQGVGVDLGHFCVSPVSSMFARTL